MDNDKIKNQEDKKEDKKVLPFGIYEAPQNIPENASGTMKIIME